MAPSRRRSRKAPAPPKTQDSQFNHLEEALNNTISREAILATSRSDDDEQKYQEAGEILGKCVADFINRPSAERSSRQDVPSLSNQQRRAVRAMWRAVEDEKNRRSMESSDKDGAQSHGKEEDEAALRESEGAARAKDKTDKGGQGLEESIVEDFANAFNLALPDLEDKDDFWLPEKRKRLGEQTEDSMCFQYSDATPRSDTDCQYR